MPGDGPSHTIGNDYWSVIVVRNPRKKEASMEYKRDGRWKWEGIGSFDAAEDEELGATTIIEVVVVCSTSG